MKNYPNIARVIPKKLHSMGSNAREKDDHLAALQYLDQAIVGYQIEGNYEGVVDALKDRMLTWKHYFLITKDNIYSILAQKDAEAMLAISKDKKLKHKLSTSYFRLGEASMLFGDNKKAIKNYKKSLEYYRGSLSEKGDYRYHLGEAMFRDGRRKTGKEVMLEGLSEIEKGASEVPEFVINVWRSGCYMRLAELLRKDSPDEAEKYLSLAKDIVKSDERLIIRKRQLQELSEKFEK
jgi:tetratricopeptide (TPR) repeat protein